jgi:hypothetical protein
MRYRARSSHFLLRSHRQMSVGFEYSAGSLAGRKYRLGYLLAPYIKV